MNAMRTIRLLLTAALLFAAPLAGWAQSCYSSGSTGITFSSVTPETYTDSMGVIYVGCQFASPGFVRMCIYVSATADPLSGVEPRRASNYNGSVMNFDLYADPSATQVLKPQDPVTNALGYTVTMSVPGGWTEAKLEIPFYGRVPAGQNLPAVSPWSPSTPYLYQSGISGGQIAWAYRPGSPPADCTSGTKTGSQSFYISVQATMSNACRISSTSDIDFGSVPALSTAVDAAGQVVVRCPMGVGWNLTLGPGMHSLGPQRRMRNAAGQYVLYDLYKDSARTQQWTSTSGVSGTGAGVTVPFTAPVHARVPAQAIGGTGVHEDMVITTLTY